MKRLVTLATIGILLPLAAPTAHAQQATGNWTPAYGAPLVVQATQSTGKQSYVNARACSPSYELDAAYGYIDGGALHLLVTGNIPMAWNIEGQSNGTAVDLFLDTRAGGQNQLRANNPTVIPTFYDMGSLTGLRFDTGFAPDWWFSVGSDFGCCGSLNVRAVMAELPTAGGGAGADLGRTPCGASAPLAGGSNPYGIAVAVLDSNTAGVTTGCGPWSGPEIRSGIEWVIPLAALGNPTDCVRACVFDAARDDHSVISNQVLGPLSPPACDLGAPGTIDFSALPGAQWFTLCPVSPSPARPSSWGALKAQYR